MAGVHLCSRGLFTGFDHFLRRCDAEGQCERMQCCGEEAHRHFRILPYCWPEFLLQIADAVNDSACWTPALMVNGNIQKGGFH